MTQFFDVIGHVYVTVGWVSGIKATAYIVLYVQFIQIVFYFNAHPRMAVLYRTVMQAMSEMIHFLLLFAALFVFLAYLAYFQFGDQVNEYSTFPGALISQVKMVFGEFIYVEISNNLEGSQFYLYWIYVITFTLIAFWILLNFFLAD